MARVPEYEQRTGAPRPASLPRNVTPDMTDPMAGALVRVGYGIERASEGLQFAQDRDAMSRAEVDISAQSKWHIDQLNELDASPLEEREERSTKLMQAAEEGWRKIEGSAGKSQRALEYIRAAGRDQLLRLHAQIENGKAAARGALTNERFETALSNRAAVVQSDPDQYLDQVGQSLVAINGSMISGAAQAEARKSSYNSLAVAALRGAAARDPEGTLADLRSEAPEPPWVSKLSPDQRAKAIEALEMQAQTARVDDATSQIMVAMSRDQRHGAAALNALQADPRLTDEEKLAVRSQVRTQAGLLADERQREYAEDVVGISRRIEGGVAGDSDVSRLTSIYRKSGLTESAFGSLLGRYDGMLRQNAEQGASAAEFRALLSAGMPLDPSNTEHRKLLDQAFAAETRGLGPLDPLRHSIALSYAAQTRMLPQSELSWLRAAARSPDFKLAAAPAQVYGRLAAQAPEALGQLDSDTRAFLHTTNALMEGGADPSKAAEAARALTFDVRKEVLDQRRQAFGSGRDALVHSQGGALKNFIDRDMDPSIWVSQPEASTMLRADFDRQTDLYFQKTGNIDTARTLAWQDLSRVYGPTEINGKKVVSAFPVERFGVTPEQVRTDLAASLPAGVNAAEVVVVPDAITMRGVSDALTGNAVQPSYRLETAQGDLVLDEDGVPLRYTLPEQAEIRAAWERAQVQAQAETAAGLARSKRIRDMLREADEMPLDFAPRLP